MIDVEPIKEDLFNLIDKIKESSEYLELKESYNILMNDKESIELINDFNKNKNEYKLNKTLENQKKLSNSKAKLYKSELYKNYDLKLKIFNEKMSLISKKINDTIFKKEIKEVLKIGE